MRKHFLPTTHLPTWLKKVFIADKRLLQLIIVLMVAAAGYAALEATHAATYASSLEAESGTLSGTTSIIADAAASGGKAIKFSNSTSDSLASFFSPAFTGTPFCLFSKQNYTISSGALTVSYPAGSTAPSMGAPYGGMQICVPSAAGPQSALTLTYKVRFPVGFQFVKGGKLPGLYGGVEPFSGGNHNPDGWSMRLMWRTGGAGEVYAYTAKTSSYGDEYGKGNFYWQADGKWHTVIEHISVNTPGATNGSVTLSYDGKQVISQGNIDVTEKSVAVGGLFFSTFYGGSDPSWAPSQNESISFSDFSVSP